jgi:hypothetical protein
MNRIIAIETDKINVKAEINDTKTADIIWQALPIQSTVNTWGEEIYFSIPVDAEPENGREVVEAGDIGYWPPGKAFCIFFGLTPASKSDEIRAASPVNIFGKVIGDAQVFSAIKNGEPISIDKVK